MTTSAYRTQDLFSIPGWLSLSRVALAAVFPCVVDQPSTALTLIAAAAVSDVLDGFVARWLGESTPTGAALDPITDKIFATSVMVSLIVTDRLTIPWAAVLSVRELLELPLLLRIVRIPRVRRARASQLSANLLGKATTVLQFIALCTLLFGSPAYTGWIVATGACGLLAAASYWRALHRALRVADPRRLDAMDVMHALGTDGPS